jgi:nicotinamidase-related amidase
MASSNPADKFARAALVIIDVQKAIDAAYQASHGPRNNVDAEMRIAKLLAAWRKDRRPLIHVRHDSTFPDSAYRPGQAGNDFKSEVEPLAGETIVPRGPIAPLSAQAWKSSCARRASRHSS